MSIRARFTSHILAFCLATLGITTCAVASASPSNGQDSTRFDVTEPTQIPGRILQPGTYTIRLIDHLSDRLIVRISHTGSTQDNTFLGLPSGANDTEKVPGPVTLKAGTGSKSALRGFVFPGGRFVEFVYPKEEAVPLAKANDTKIPAVDPASQGMKADPNLTPEEMKIVSLWVLSPASVGPDASGVGIKAEAYHPPSGTPSPKQRTLIAALPHTAGTLPIYWLVGLTSLFGASLLASRRLSAS